MKPFDLVCLVAARPRAGGDTPWEFLCAREGAGARFPEALIASGRSPEEACADLAAEQGLVGRAVGVLTAFSRVQGGRYTLRVVAVLFEVEVGSLRADLEWAGPTQARASLVQAEHLEALRAARAHLEGAGEEGCGPAPIPPGERAIVALEDDPRRAEAMRAALEPLDDGLHFLVFDNAPDTLRWLADHLAQVALISLDHDLGPTRSRKEGAFDPGSGRDVVDWLATQAPTCPVIVHTSNHLAAPGMELALRWAGWRRFRVVPFSDLEWVQTSWREVLARALAGEEPLEE